MRLFLSCCLLGAIAIVWVVAAQAGTASATRQVAVVPCKIGLPAPILHKATGGHAIISAQSYLDIDLADRSSRGCAWHFQGGYYVINIIRYQSLSDAKADFANGCSGLNRTGSPGVHACVSDSDRGAGIGRFRYSHSVETLKGRVLVLVGGESGPPQTPRSFDERVARLLLARP